MLILRVSGFHSRSLSSDGAQYTDGIAGALIVYPTAAAPSDFPTWDQEIVIELNDWYHTLATTLEEEFLSVSDYC